MQVIINKRFRLYCIIIFFLCKISLYAQENNSFINSIDIETKILTGTVYPHYSFINLLVDDYQNGFEIQCRTKTYGRTTDDFYYRYPSLGLAYQNISFGNKDKLGRASMIFAVIDVPIVTKNKFSLLYQGNFGTAIAHKPLNESVYNTLLSNKTNYYIGFDAIAEYAITSKNKVRTSFELSHISNGKIKTPNLGVNSYQISVSYVHQLKQAKYAPIYTSKPAFSKKHSIYTGIYGSYKRDDYLTTKKYPASTILIDYEYQTFPKYGFSFGADIFYDESINARKTDFQKFTDRTKIIESGIHSGIYIHYSHMAFIVQFGKYLITKSEKPPYYSRVGLRYQFNHWYTNLGLKSHKTTADFLELGFGYKFSCK